MSKDVQRNFSAAGAQDVLRSELLLGLIALRRSGASDENYWSKIGPLAPPRPDDLTAIFPPERTPKLTDGEITYKYLEWYGEQKGQILTTTRQTLSQTRAQELLAVMEHIGRESPETFDHIFDTMYDWRIVEYVTAVHMMDGQEALRDHLLARVKDMDDFILAAGRTQEKFLDNEYYPMDNELSHLTRELTSLYVMRKIPRLDHTKTETLEDDDLLGVLKFVTRHDISLEGLEYINRNAPLPERLLKIHRNGCARLQESLFDDPQFALDLAGVKQNFAELTWEQKLHVGRVYLETLAESYGVHPPPDLHGEDELDSYAAHTPWSYTDKEACYAHPMGIIKIDPSKDWSSFDDFMTTLNHEFTHALEDVSLYTLNSDFQEWKKKSPENAAVKTGHEKLQDNFRATGLLMAFNTNSRNSAAYGSSQEGDYFTDGRYYSHKAEYTSGDPARDEEEKSKTKTRHLAQLRERHAYLLEEHITSQLTGAIERVERCKDPLPIFMRSQLLTYPVKDMLTLTIRPCIAAKDTPAFDQDVKKIDDLFRHADARTSTYEERLRSMALGFMNAQKLMLQASNDGLLDLEEPPTKALYLKLKEQITDDRIGLHILELEEANSAPESEPQSALTPA